MAIRKTPVTTPEEVLPVEPTLTPEEGFLPEEAVITPEEVLPPVTPPSLDVAPAIIKGPDPIVEVQNSTISATTEYKLANGKFVGRYYPLFEDEEPGIKACVTINGVPYWFEKGKQITIPEAVAAVYDITVERKTIGSQRSRAKLASRPDFINAFK